MALDTSLAEAANVRRNAAKPKRKRGRPIRYRDAYHKRQREIMRIYRARRRIREQMPQQHRLEVSVHA